MENYEKLKGICLQIDNLIALKVVRSSNEFQKTFFFLFGIACFISTVVLLYHTIV